MLPVWFGLYPTEEDPRCQNVLKNCDWCHNKVNKQFLVLKVRSNEAIQHSSTLWMSHSQVSVPPEKRQREASTCLKPPGVLGSMQKLPPHPKWTEHQTTTNCLQLSTICIPDQQSTPSKSRTNTWSKNVWIEREIDTSLNKLRRVTTSKQYDRITEWSKEAANKAVKTVKVGQRWKFEAL